MSYLIDSDWLIDAQIGEAAAVGLLAQLRDDGLAVSIISYGELFEGAIGAPDPENQFDRFRAFLRRFILVPLTEPIMEVFARTRADLRRTGQLIPDMDLLIASTAIHHDLTLLTRNVRHFRRIPELKLRQPSKAPLLGGRWRALIVFLGFVAWGQSGSRPALYEYAGIDPDEIVNAALLALELNEE